MNRVTAVVIVLFCLIAGMGTSVVAQETERPIRILLTYGGHGFEEGPFFAMFDALPGIEYTRAPLPARADLLRPGLQQQYDVIVKYDMARGFTPEQRDAFVALLSEGIGLVSLHHNIGAHSDWEEFARIIGGRFFFNETTMDGRTYPPSTWSQGETIRVTVADQDHPITAGIEDFEIVDETYGGFFTTADRHVLLRTDHPKNDPDVAWTLRYGNSPVFFLMLGHCNLAWQNPVYPRLLEQGIRWAAGRSLPPVAAGDGARRNDDRGQGLEDLQ